MSELLIGAPIIRGLDLNQQQRFLLEHTAFRQVPQFVGDLVKATSRRRLIVIVGRPLEQISAPT